MPAPTTPTLTPHAKATIAGVLAVLLIGWTAYQGVSNGHFRWLDLVPVAVCVIGAIQTRLIPNVPELPWAKGVVAAAAAVVGAISTLVAADPQNVTIVKIAIFAGGALLVWFVPEAGPDAAELVTDLTAEPFTVDTTGAQSGTDGGHPAAAISAPAPAPVVPVVVRDISETQPFPAVPPQPPAPAPAADAAPVPTEAPAATAPAASPAESGTP